jgi:putative transposase
MKTNTTPPHYKGYRFPPEIISHAVWLYFRFSLSFRDVEELMAKPGIMLTYETVRQWCLKFGQTYANELRRRRPRCGDKWCIISIIGGEKKRSPSGMCMVFSRAGRERPA